MRDIDLLTKEVIGAAIEVHRELGPGLLESTYLQCLCRELSLRNISFQMEVPLPVRYKGVLLDCGYRMDLLIEDCLIVELKSIEKLLPIHQAQLLTYLKISGHSIGLLINSNVKALRLGLKRVVNNLPENASAPLR